MFWILHVVADPRAVHHDDVLAEAAALADHRAGHDVTEVPDLGAGADRRAVVDVRRLVDERAVAHRHASSRRTVAASARIALPFLQRPHRAVAATAATGSRRDAALAADIVVVYDTRLHDRRLAQRVVVQLRVLADRRVDRAAATSPFTIMSRQFGRPSCTLNTRCAGMPRARRYAAVPAVAMISKPISWKRRAIGVTVGLSESFTVMSTAPSSGSPLTAASCAFANALPNESEIPMHLARRPHLGAEHRIGARGTC